MTPQRLKDDIILLSSNDLVSYVESNKNEIRTLFLKLSSSIETTELFEQILLKLSQLHLTPDIVNTIQVQSLIVHLAFYFKKAKHRSSVDWCYNVLLDSVFKKRLDAWLFYKRYHNHDSYILLFPQYLQKLTETQNYGGDEYTFEVLDDLREHKLHGLSVLDTNKRTKFEALFTSPELQAAYPLLEEFVTDKKPKMPGLDTTDYDNKEYKLSVFTNEIFNTRFLDYVKENSQPDYPNKVFSYPASTIRYDIIKKGQADFDAIYHRLAPSDIVKLYCYFNMRMHFFSSLSLFERSSIIQHYNSTGKIKFIDLGCGPATSGLALVEHIYQNTGTEVVFDYWGIDSSLEMQKQAKLIMDNHVFSNTNIHKYHSNISEIELDDLANSTCIIVNACYLFASPTLPLLELVGLINNLKTKYPYKPKYLLFQNPDVDYLNENYKKFKDMISNFDNDFSKVDVIYYHNTLNPYFSAKQIEVFFEILKF